jgi:type IV secretory pathway protease TraF
VPEGALFVLGTHERSFDSRYWGYVEAPEVTGRVLALR